MIYLATPYSHKSEAVKRDRFEDINKVAARLMNEGRYVFSPISHTHPIALAGNLPGDFKYWDAYDQHMMSMCDTLIVYCADGWIESVGVQAEIKIAKSMGLEIQYMDADK